MTAPLLRGEIEVEKKYTILDVAKEAGVGKSTVSRVLNNDPHVREKTRKIVQEVIERLNFIPSKSAQGMRGKKDKIIGVIVTRLDSFSETSTIRGIMEESAVEGFDLIFSESRFSYEKIQKEVEVFVNKQVEAIVIFALGGYDYEFVKEIKIPVLMIGQEIKNIPSIVYDDYGAIKKILDYLYEKNKKNIAYIGVELNDLTTGYLRYSAYKDFCEEKGIKNIAEFGEFTYNDGYERAKKIFANEKKLDAVICGTDSISFGVKKYVMENNFDEIIVTGIGYNKLTKFLFPKHITVDLMYKESGKKAAELLKNLINKEEIEDKTVMNSEIVY